MRIHQNGGSATKTGFTFRSNTSSFGEFGTGSSSFVKPLDTKTFHIWSKNRDIPM